jgi:hypothetical protein
MSTQPLTYEGVLKMFETSGLEFDRRMEESRQEFKQRMEESRQEFDKRMAETDRKLQESAEQIRKTSHEIERLTSSVGRVIENMVAGNIVKKFRALGYDVTGCSPNKEFEIEALGIAGEIDLLLDDGPVGILVEVKTTLKTDDVRDHVEKIKEYRRYVDARGFGDKRHFIGAVAGAVVSKETVNFAQKNGMYVIVQSGDAVEILAQPEGFKAKEW